MRATLQLCQIERLPNPVLAGMRNLVMTKANYEVYGVFTVEAATAAIRRQNFDLIVLGHSLGPIKHKYLIEQVRSICKIPVLCITNSSQQNVGADAHFPGLEGAEDLLRAMEELLHRSLGKSAS